MFIKWDIVYAEWQDEAWQVIQSYPSWKTTIRTPDWRCIWIDTDLLTKAPDLETEEEQEEQEDEEDEEEIKEHGISLYIVILTMISILIMAVLAWIVINKKKPVEIPKTRIEILQEEINKLQNSKTPQFIIQKKAMWIYNESVDEVKKIDTKINEKTLEIYSDIKK